MPPKAKKAASGKQKSPPEPPSTPRLFPNELIDLIAHWLDVTDQRQTLARLQQTSKEIYHIATPHLFRTITIDARSAKFLLPQGDLPDNTGPDSLLTKVSITARKRAASYKDMRDGMKKRGQGKQDFKMGRKEVELWKAANFRYVRRIIVRNIPDPDVTRAFENMAVRLPKWMLDSSDIPIAGFESNLCPRIDAMSIGRDVIMSNSPYKMWTYGKDCIMDVDRVALWSLAGGLAGVAQLRILDICLDLPPQSVMAEKASNLISDILPGDFNNHHLTIHGYDEYIFVPTHDYKAFAYRYISRKEGTVTLRETTAVSIKLLEYIWGQDSAARRSFGIYGQPAVTDEVCVEIIFPSAHLTTASGPNPHSTEILDQIRMGILDHKNNNGSWRNRLRNFSLETIDKFVAGLDIGYKQQHGDTQHEDLLRACDACGEPCDMRDPAAL